MSFQIKQTMIINELPSNKYAANHIYSNIGQVPYPFFPLFLHREQTDRIYGNQEDNPGRVSEVCECSGGLHQSPPREEIDLKSLAKISHFSPFYFHRIMKAFLGEPIGTFIVRTRTETAARLLRYTDLPIADIAYRIGYSSSSSLSKVFKQFYGISPLEYRNNKNFVIMKPAIIRPELKLKREIKELPVRNMIYIRLFGDYKLNDYCGTWMRLQQFVQEEKLPMGEVMPYCIFHDDPK